MSDLVPAVLVHGGIDMDSGRSAMEALGRAGAAGVIASESGGAVAAVVAAVSVLEADPRFNAGLGSVLNADGDVECDAGVMDGRNGRFAGVGAVPGILHPVQVAASLLREQRQMLLVGDGAASYARAVGHALAELRTDEQAAAWEDYRRSIGLRSPFTGRVPSETVGAIAVGPDGSIAAASSTGGLLNKRPGRVGDSAIVGAGLFATETTAAVCSGVGEAAVGLALARWTVERLTAPVPAGQAVAEAVRRAWEERHAATAVVAYDAVTGAYAAAHAGSRFPVLRCTAAGQERLEADRLTGSLR